jgi:hypothetical protein
VRRAVVRSFSESNGGKLGERTYRIGQAAAREQASRDEGGGHGAEARQKDAELAGGRLYLDRSLHRFLSMVQKGEGET